MEKLDDFCAYHEELLEGRYDCVDRIVLNGHEWVERQARRQTISISKEGNCFVGGSFQALDRLADTLCDEHAIGRLTEVCDRWVYSSCLCFALDLEEQRRSRFRYRYSADQIEYSCNMLFTRGTILDAVFQGLIDRTRRHLDVPKLRTLFGIRILAGMLVLRERVIKPVLSGLGKRRVGRPPKHIHPIDQHYHALQQELRRTFVTLGLAA